MSTTKRTATTITPPTKQKKSTCMHCRCTTIQAYLSNCIQQHDVSFKNGFKLFKVALSNRTSCQ